MHASSLEAGTKVVNISVHTKQAASLVCYAAILVEDARELRDFEFSKVSDLKGALVMSLR